jgi:hypothetical protein
VSQRGLDGALGAGLRQYAGTRVNLFRAMHTSGVFVDRDQWVLALREEDYALTARVVFDLALEYYYVCECRWYRSDLSRIDDHEIPEPVRWRLLRRFETLID